MKASREKMGSRTPKLTVDDFDGDVVILTIAAYEEFVMEQEEPPRLCATLLFNETGDKALFLNATMMDDLIAGFGTDETDDWIGQQIPLEKRKSRFKGRQYDKVYVVAHEEWDEYLEPKSKPRKSVARKSTSRRKKR